MEVDNWKLLSNETGILKKITSKITSNKSSKYNINVNRERGAMYNVS